VRKALGFVRDDVLKATFNRQEPFVYGSLGGDDVALVPAPSIAPPQAPTRSQADARGDYELAMQVGTKAALNAFLAQYPDGFYASLAHSELDKIAAAEAQSAKVQSQPPASAPAQMAKADDKPRAAPITAPAAQPAPDKSLNVAALNAGTPPVDLARSVQAELRRVGCLNADADGKWTADTQHSLSQFNRYAGTKFDTKTASADALDAIKQKQARVCPLVCEHGFKTDGDHCTRIVCAEGSFLNDDNECEKRRGKPAVAKRSPNEAPARERATSETDGPRAPASGYGSGSGYGSTAGSGRGSDAGSGQIVCTRVGCRAVARGCHAEFRTTQQGGPVEGGGGNIEICR
jgi:hypothetical protein